MKELHTKIKRAVPSPSSATLAEDVIADMRREMLLEEWGKGRSFELFLVKPLNAITLIKKETIKDRAAVLAKAAFGVDMEQFLEQLRPLPGSVQQRASSKNSKQTAEVTEEDEGKQEQALDRLSMELMDLILKGMRDLDSAVETGATVLIRDVRRHMPTEYRGHDSFDPAVMRLAAEGKVVLRPCDSLSTLSEQELDELVRNPETGAYYVSMGHHA